MVQICRTLENMLFHTVVSKVTIPWSIHLYSSLFLMTAVFIAIVIGVEVIVCECSSWPQV